MNILHTKCLIYSWLNKTFTFCSENSDPFQLHHAHMRKDTRLSSASNARILERGSLEMKLCGWTKNGVLFGLFVTLAPLISWGHSIC